MGVISLVNWAESRGGICGVEEKRSFLLLCVRTYTKLSKQNKWNLTVKCTATVWGYGRKLCRLNIFNIFCQVQFAITMQRNEMFTEFCENFVKPVNIIYQLLLNLLNLRSWIMDDCGNNHYSRYFKAKIQKP